MKNETQPDRAIDEIEFDRIVNDLVSGRIDRKDLTAEGAEDAEGEMRERINFDAAGFNLKFNSIELLMLLGGVKRRVRFAQPNLQSTNQQI